MRFLAIADTHLGYTTGRTSIARQKFSDYVFNQFEYCIKEAIRLKVDYLIHSGDVFDRSQPKPIFKNKFFSLVEELLENQIGVLLVPGNHDRSRLDNSLLNYFYQNFYLFNHFRKIDLDEFHVIGFPYNSKDIQMIISKIRSNTKNDKKPVFVLCHQLFYGGWFGPQHYTFTNHDAIHFNAFEKNIQVITGHIHRAQTLFDNQIVYCGSTIRTSFQEAIEPKGYLEINLTNDRIEILYHKIKTKDMEIHEIEGQNKLNLNNIESQINNNNARILLRLTNTKMTSDLLKKLYVKFEANTYPYLRISPSKSDNLLLPLYSNYKYDFNFKPIRRSLW